MTAECEREVSLPGVGVWTPGTAQLEGDVVRVRRVTHEHSPKRLIVNIHDSSELQETLALANFQWVRELVLNYYEHDTFTNLKWSLDGLAPLSLDSLIVSGVACNPWQVETLRLLYRGLASATLDFNGVLHHPRHTTGVDEIHAVGDAWFRQMDHEAVVTSRYFPWTKHEIESLEIDSLVVDCDEQFHPTWIEPVKQMKLRRLTLLNVTAGSHDLFAWLDGLNVPEFRVTSNDRSMHVWSKALTMRMRLKGTRFVFECP